MSRLPTEVPAPGVTSADVARESGVSRTTVSYVLNSKEGAASRCSTSPASAIA